ncbi:14216_t:CDS:2 [Entrophospora sp. SA101]|nr:14216_t:CDS:2 [Entrophospora sp. SA101]
MSFINTADLSEDEVTAKTQIVFGLISLSNLSRPPYDLRAHFENVWVLIRTN